MDLSTLVVHIARDLVAAQAFVRTIAMGVGIGYCANAVIQAMQQSASASFNTTIISSRKIFIPFLIGVLIIHLTGTMSHVWESMMGRQQMSYGMVSYFSTSNMGMAAFVPAMNAVLTIISTLGWCYGLQGWILLRKASISHGGYQQAGWRGMMHILGGAAMINITDTLDALKETIS